MEESKRMAQVLSSWLRYNHLTYGHKGQRDVGICNIAPVTFDLSSNEPIGYHSTVTNQEADEGIASTVQGTPREGSYYSMDILHGTLLFFSVQKPGH